tara:strand:+ start:1973 stop:2692 length:720 start_codon:yes stop_codon:yes gene_type:complete
MQFNLDKITIIMILILSVLLYYSANLSNSNRKIKSIEIIIKPTNLNFISNDSVLKMVDKYTLSSKVKIHLSKIEEEINKINSVQNAEAYIFPNQKLFLDIKQKEPIARIFTNDSVFYLDKNSNFMSLSNLQSVKVPLIFGYSKQSDLKYLTKISLLIKNDDFLSNNISQIIILENQHINLRFRHSNTIIELGNNFDLHNKIQNLKAFYTRAYAINEVDKYKKLNLKFENQVVAVKKINL